MGLLGDGLLPFEKPNLVLNDDQLEIIDGLDNLAWDLKTSAPQYIRVKIELNQEYKIAHIIDREIVAKLLQQELEGLTLQTPQQSPQQIPHPNPQ